MPGWFCWIYVVPITNCKPANLVVQCLFTAGCLQMFPTQVTWCETEHTWVQPNCKNLWTPQTTRLGHVFVVSCKVSSNFWVASTNFQPWCQPMINNIVDCKIARGTIFVADHCITNGKPQSLACCLALTEGWIGTSSQWGLEAMGIFKNINRTDLYVYTIDNIDRFNMV